MRKLNSTLWTAPLARGIVILQAIALVLPLQVKAATQPPADVIQAVVWVQCADRQGSGTVINNVENYVLTNAHVVMDVETGIQATSCVVGFPDVTSLAPVYLYQASVHRIVFNEQKNQDFAILQIGAPLSHRTLQTPFPFLKTNEFPVQGEAISVMGYLGPNKNLVTSQGLIQNFQDGFIQTTAQIAPGDSGGAGLDNNFRLIGIPTRIVTITQESGQVESVTYELEDIRAVMTWLDTYGLNEHDKYFTHEDYARYHQNAVFINQTDLGCEDVVRTKVSPTVYCLLPGNTRLGFPNEATFLTWFPDFSKVFNVASTSLATYILTRNVTFKPGTLVKSATAPSVYIVVDSFGTMRWIPSEDKARQLWGPNWASLVHDIPDEFWTNYTVGQPLDG